MELLPSEPTDHPIDLMRRAIDEHHDKRTPEEADAITAQCVGCFALADTPTVFTARDVANCRGIPIAQASDSLNRMADMHRPTVYRRLRSGFVSRYIGFEGETPKDCFRTMTEAERAQQMRPKLTERLDDAAVLSCISCIASRTETDDLAVRPNDIARCVEFGRTRVSQALVRLAAKDNELITPQGQSSGNQVHEIDRSRLPSVVTPAWCQTITLKRYAPKATKDSDTRSNTKLDKDARLAATKQCITCHAQRIEPGADMTISASAIAACIGSDRQRIGDAMKQLFTEDRPLVTKAAEKTTQLTPHALEVARTDPVPCRRASERRQAIISGIVGCLRCIASTPDSAGSTITAQDIADCRNFSVKDVEQVLCEEDLPIVTTKVAGAYRAAPQVEPSLKDMASPTEEISQTCDEQFITWVCETVEASQVKIHANLLRALKDGYIVIAQDDRDKAKSTPVHTTGRFLAIGPALYGLRKSAQQAVLHVMGMDELVYGRRLDQDLLRAQLGISDSTSLVDYARFALQRLQNHATK